jgi:sn-glycerol 3-phosphate transport system substrate-binding protein
MNKHSQLFSLCLLVVLSLLSNCAIPTQTSRIPIEFWYASWHQDFIEQNIEPAFEARFPQYDLVSRPFNSYAEIWENYLLAREQGELPALIQGQEIFTQVMRDSGYFKPLGEAIGDRTAINGIEFALNDILPVVGAYYQIDGQFYSMPWNTSSAVLFANMDILIEAGIASNLNDRAAIPDTWAEMESACEAILTNTEAECAWWPIDTWWITMPLAQMGQVYVNNYNGRSTRADQVILTSDAAIAAFSWWASMEERGFYAPYGPNTDELVPETDFVNGRIAFISHSSGMTAHYTAAFAESDYTLGVGFLPYNQEYEYHSVTLGGGTIYLSNRLPPDVEEGALTFMAFNILPENDAAFHRASGYVPIRLSTAQILEAEGWDPNFRVAFDQFKAGHVTPAIGALLPTFPETDVVVLQAIEIIMYRDAPLMETLRQAEADATATLQEYNRLLTVDE